MMGVYVSLMNLSSAGELVFQLIRDIVLALANSSSMRLIHGSNILPLNPPAVDVFGKGTISCERTITAGLRN